MKSWLQIIRLPNLFTVPGDVVAGALLASATITELSLLPFAILASLALYCAGLILNDLFDRDIDKKERPQRPIPSGNISPSQAIVAAALLIASALFFAYLAGVLKLSIFLIVLIFFYNGAARKLPVIGFLTLGACRGANLLLGASITSQTFTKFTLAAALVVTFYIFFVSYLASSETFAGSAGPKRIEQLIRGLIVIQAIFVAIAFKGGALPLSVYLGTFLLLLVFLAGSKITAEYFYGS
jgi:4-hydroxybenzoate polyprenyltransferase